MNRKHAVPLAITVFLSALVSPAVSAQSSDPCKDQASQKTWDEGSSPVYADAGELGGSLSKRGFVVQCIRRSVEERLFSSEKGAAWFKTNKGVFEVWFLPKPQNFSRLQINSRQTSGDRYIYTFRGTPRIATRIDSSQPISYIKNGNMLFEVWGDQPLAASLSQAFRNP